MPGKITGMMLEMDNSELLMLLDSLSSDASPTPMLQLRAKADEAMRVLSGRS